MWQQLQPEQRAQYEKLGLATRIEKLARINFMKSASPRAQKGEIVSEILSARRFFSEI
mgnify:CR=1 FL=1|jgi:hypothetical protein|eukprot:COSAG03_NODE_17_length_21787_cov_46.088436_5_plen_58_part_00